jgi:AcrR family transcriptional regulator
MLPSRRTRRYAPRSLGRKRSQESRLAILTAAFELTAELGYAGLTIEGIAARSGTGKQTIYRWWPSKADVLLDALPPRPISTSRFTRTMAATPRTCTLS